MGTPKSDAALPPTLEVLFDRIEDLNQQIAALRKLPVIQKCTECGWETFDSCSARDCPVVLCLASKE
jgi:hypothetical protein